MVIWFEENEDLGPIKWNYIEMQNFVYPDWEEETLIAINKMLGYILKIVIFYLLIKDNPLVWNVVDMIITMCFFIYLNVKMPFQLDLLFKFFNWNGVAFNPHIIQYFFGDIEG